MLNASFRQGRVQVLSTRNVCEGLKVCSHRTTLSPLTGDTYDLFDGHCDRQNGLHTHFACQPNVCYDDGEGVVWCE